MRHIIDAIAAQGRNGDDDLLHVTKGEMAGLDALARRHFGRGLSRNPRTGLREASLFRDWFGNDVGTALDIAAPVATAFIPGVGPVAAAAMGAGIGAANQGLGKGGTTESALMGGVMGGIGAYGGAGLAEGLGAGAAAASGDVAASTGAGLTPTATAGANLGTGTIADVGANLPLTATANAPADVALTALPGGGAGETLSSTNMLAQPSGATGLTAPTTNAGTGLKLGTDTAGSTNVLNSTANTSTGGGAGLKATAPNGSPITSMGGNSAAKPLNWDYLTTKGALSNAVPIATSAMGTAAIPQGIVPNTGSSEESDDSMPEAEVYYTSTGERRTRIKAAEGGLMQFADYDASDAQADGGYAPGGIAHYDNGGIAMLRSLQPGGQWGDASGKLYGMVQEQKPEWLKGIEPGGFLGAMVPGKSEYEAQQRRKQEEEDAKAAEEKAKKEKAAQAGQYQQQFAGGGIASFGAGRYLQGPGDGMSDSIPASIDGKQEARLATGEFVVPADVVSHLGNGDSSAGAKQLHNMMDRARMTRTGTKRQGKQINPRKVMPV